MTEAKPIDRALLTEEVSARFLAKVALPEDADGCMVWIACRGKNGYGRFGLGGGWVYAHRVAYELFVGKIPPGLVIDHLCRNRACVRPDHLSPVTNRDNILAPGSLSWAAAKAAQTHCVRGGHLLTGENLVRRSVARGVRDCRACNNATSAARRARVQRGEQWTEADFLAYADARYLQLTGLRPDRPEVQTK